MAFKLVLVEREDIVNKSVISNSGILIDENFVLITSNLFKNDLDFINFQINRMTPNKLYPDVFKNICLPLNVLWKNGELYEVRKARIFSAFISRNVKESNKDIFKNWAIDSIDNNTNINNLLSLFFILTLDGNKTEEDVKISFKKWWDRIGRLKIHKVDSVRIESVSFGNRLFMDSCSKGIISNIFGNDSCFLLSDCLSTPGSEGSPVYLDSHSQKLSKDNVPFGAVLSSVNWCKGEWLGLTLIVDLRSILIEIIELKVLIDFDKIKYVNKDILATTEFSLVQIYSESSWGSAVLLNEENGFFITNSHVLKSNDIKLYYKGNSYNAKLIYKTPEDEEFDLAIVESAEIISKEKLRQIEFSHKAAKLGDPVFAAGFSIFSKTTLPTPTLTRGCISNIGKYMMKTTCCIHAGASGGAILDIGGNLLGIIVCNVKLLNGSNNAVVYARVNMAIPAEIFRNTIMLYLQNKDNSVLNMLHTNNQAARLIWKRIEGKL